MSRSPEPSDFALAKAEEEDSQNREGDGDDQILAADYDPSLDRREDEQKRIGGVAPAKDESHVDEVEEVEEEVEEEEELDDMFAVAMGEKKQKKVKKVLVSVIPWRQFQTSFWPQKKKVAAPALITTTTLDSAADPEGYYSIILGEQLDGARYQVFSSLGKGMFANVVRARILQGEPGEAGKEVAIKIVRCQESMYVYTLARMTRYSLSFRYKAGQKEIQILNKIKQADPDDKKHIVRLERTFEHRGHLCLVFESLRYVGYISDVHFAHICS